MFIEELNCACLRLYYEYVFSNGTRGWHQLHRNGPYNASLLTTKKGKFLVSIELNFGVSVK